MPNIVQNYNETTNDPEYPLTYEEAILDPDGNPIKGYVKEAVVAPQYDPTTGTYAVGDPVMDDKKYYRCNTAVASPEDFDPTKWTEKTISEEIDGLNQSLTELQGVNCYRKFFTLGGGAYSITNVEPGDLIFFIRNGAGLVAIADNNTVLEVITLQSITGVSYNSNTKTISFTRSSSYTGGVLVLSKNGNVALAS